MGRPPEQKKVAVILRGVAVVGRLAVSGGSTVIHTFMNS